jgi:hypothetical protein
LPSHFRTIYSLVDKKKIFILATWFAFQFWLQYVVLYAENKYLRPGLEDSKANCFGERSVEALTGKYYAPIYL